MRRYKHRLVCTPGDRVDAFSIPVWSVEPNTYVRAQVFVQSPVALTSGMAVFRFGGDFPSEFAIGGNSFEQQYRIVPGASQVSFELEVDSGATFTDDEVTADIFIEAPPGFGFIYSNDGGPGFMLTLQALQPD